MANKTKKKQLKDNEIALVLYRLETLSPKVYFSSGSGGNNISRDDMIKHINNRDEIGEEFVKTDIEFLRAFKNGKLLKQIIAAQKFTVTP